MSPSTYKRLVYSEDVMTGEIDMGFFNGVEVLRVLG